MISAQQELFMAVKFALQQLGYDVYDNMLPPDGTPYPFVYMAETTQNQFNAKAQDAGYVRLTIQVWGKPTMRGTISAMAEKIRNVVRTIETSHYGYTLQEYEQRIINDNTTRTPLMQSYNSLMVFFSRR